MLAPGVQAAAASSPISRAAPASGTSITGHGVNGGGGADGGEGGQGEGRGGDGDGGGIGGERAAPCRLEGRVENWEPSDTADLKSAYRWKDEKKVSQIEVAIMVSDDALGDISIFISLGSTSAQTILKPLFYGDNRVGHTLRCSGKNLTPRPKTGFSAIVSPC